MTVEELVKFVSHYPDDADILIDKLDSTEVFAVDAVRYVTPKGSGTPQVFLTVKEEINF